MNVQKILVPYDGSSFSNKAFKAALDLAQKYDSKIIIVSCINTFTSGWFGKSGFEQTILKKLRGKIMKEIQDLEKIARKRNVSTNGRILETPSVTKTLLTFAKTNKIDLIVIGSRGQSGLKDLFLGSISHGIIQRAKCPVFVIK